MKTVYENRNGVKVLVNRSESNGEWPLWDDTPPKPAKKKARKKARRKAK